jgi:hypothetical protein
MNLMRGFGLVLMGTLLTSCVTTQKLYNGAEIGRDQVAELENWSGPKIKMIDGQNVKGAKYALLPGEHQISMKFQNKNPFKFTDVELNFNAKAGRSYRICQKRLVKHEGMLRAGIDATPFGRRQIFIWIEDKETAEVVAGHKPHFTRRTLPFGKEEYSAEWEKGYEW